MFEADLNFSRPSLSEIKVQIKWLSERAVKFAIYCDRGSLTIFGNNIVSLFPPSFFVKETFDMKTNDYRHFLLHFLLFYELVNPQKS